MLLLIRVRNCVIEHSHRIGTAKSSSEFKKRIQPIMDGHAPRMVNIRWGSVLLLMSPRFYVKRAHLFNYKCVCYSESAIGSMNTAITLSTATSSSEFKKCIQPIMDGHAPTMVNIRCGSIVFFHMSP